MTLKHIRVLAPLWALLLLLCACGVQETVPAAESSAAPASIQTAANAETSANAETAGTAADPHALLDTLFFASDYQKLLTDSAPEPADTLTDILQAIYDDGYTLDNAVFCGDYTNEKDKNNYNVSPESSIAEIKDIFTGFDADWKSDDMLFVQGNHDEMTESLSETGLYEYDNYLVYVLNTQSDYPWHQGSDVYADGASHEETVKAGAARLEKCLTALEQRDEQRPIFIAGHVPLHYSARTSTLRKSGDNLYSSYVFDVVNDAAQTLNIVYLVGHNHSSGWDDYLGGSTLCLEAGDTILLPHLSEGISRTDSFDEATLNFTYLNAGYVGYVNGEADTTLTGTLCQIYTDELVLTRYCGDGVWLMHGTGTKCADPDDSGIIHSEYYEPEAQESPLVVTLK